MSFSTTTATYDDKGFTICTECSSRATVVQVHRTDARAHAEMHRLEQPCCDKPHSEESPCWNIYAVMGPRSAGTPWRDA